MRKEYVKPVMESEEFVSNEYVAACWTATCLECGTEKEAYDNMATGIKNGALTSTDDVYVYAEEFNGVPGCSSSTSSTAPSWATTSLGAVIWWFLKIFWGAQDETTTTYYHPINLEEGWTNHPNASV